jgi:vancomycin permeability regulator SanA
MRPFTGKADVAVVLGTTLKKNGNPSPWLRGRIVAALDLYRRRQVKKIFVSGMIETDTHYPQGDVMKNYLVQRGVNPNDVIVDNYGDNTYLTAIHFNELSNRYQFNSAVVVSSFYHISRSKYIIRKMGYKNKLYSDFSRALFWKDWQGLPRDCVAFYKYLLVY